MNEENLIKYYNKFNEDKRLSRRHGQVEYITAMKYIHKYLSKMNNPKILDIGAGTGKYSIALSNEGYDVTAIELVKHNLMTLKSKNSNIKAFQGNAINLKKFKDKTFDMILLFGPMYHLISDDEKLMALFEAKRILKDDGIILISYYMNEYCVITHGFKEGLIKSSLDDGLLDKNFHILSKKDDLYSMVRLEDINRYNKKANLKRIKILAQDGPADYLRPIINKMDEEEFKIFIKYHLKTCERKELLGASSHVLDILKK
ncbi:MAG: class I SAM-dependent methyltransferase [Bacilli bacterium]